MSHTSSDKVTHCQISETNLIWELIYERELSDSEHREIRKSVSDFFEILQAWSKESILKPVQQKGESLVRIDT